jgi:hypothetical protein
MDRVNGLLQLCTAWIVTVRFAGIERRQHKQDPKREFASACPLRKTTMFILTSTIDVLVFRELSGLMLPSGHLQRSHIV